MKFKTNEMIFSMIFLFFIYKMREDKLLLSFVIIYRISYVKDCIMRSVV